MVGGGMGVSEVDVAGWVRLYVMCRVCSLQ